MSQKLGNGRQASSSHSGSLGAGVLDVPAGTSLDGYSSEETAAFFDLVAAYVKRISMGDLPPKITDEYQGSFNGLKNSLNALIDVVQMRNADIQTLIDASVDGKLDFRADSRKYVGENGKLIDGVNQMLDAILLPIGEGNRILAQISNGKIDELIAQTYKGDHEKMKQAVNNVALVLQGLQ